MRFCSVETCKYGSGCARSERAAVASDSNYEDEEGGWAVVGGGRYNKIRAQAIMMLADGQP